MIIIQSGAGGLYSGADRRPNINKRPISTLLDIRHTLVTVTTAVESSLTLGTTLMVTSRTYQEPSPQMSKKSTFGMQKRSIPFIMFIIHLRPASICQIYKKQSFTIPSWQVILMAIPRSGAIQDITGQDI